MTYQITSFLHFADDRTILMRIILLSIIAITVYLAIKFELSYAGLAILIGIALPIIYMIFDSGRPEKINTGYYYVGFGVICLLIAYLVCEKYGISFDALDRNRSLPRAVRNLPYFGITSITMGITYMTIWFFGKPQE